MKLKIFALTIIILSFSIPCHAWQLIDWNKLEKKTGWNQTDVELEVGWLLLHGLDWVQTLKISRNTPSRVPPGVDYYYEKMAKPVLGKYPSKGRVNTVCALVTVGQITITHYLPRRCDLNLFGWEIRTQPKRWFQYVCIGWTGYNVGRNYSIGLRFNF